jgi:hypothetical protein
MMTEIPEKCEATIALGDDHGDNLCTFHCQLPKGHDGLHVETGEMDLPSQLYTMTWQGEGDGEEEERE